MTDIVHLSWRRILYDSGILDAPIISKLNFHYRLYQECIQYLREQHPPGSLTCATLHDIVGQGVQRLPLPFITLVNLLADRRLVPEVDNIKEGTMKLDGRSVLDWILSGMLTVHALSHHVACGAQADTSDPNLCKAVFLDIITDLWTRRCYLRKGVVDSWSPKMCLRGLSPVNANSKKTESVEEVSYCYCS